MTNDNIEKALKLRSWVKISHHIPGRIRLKYRLSIIAHLARFNEQDISNTLDKVPALRNYQLNKTTGSILIEYDASVVNPVLLDDLFSGDDSTAKRACYDLADCLNINGVNS